MSQDYAEKMIAKALKAAKGNQTIAKQQIIAWAQQDAKLLQGLTRAHLTGIVAYQIDRVASGRAARSKMPAPAKPKERPADEEFGMELMKAVASSSAAVFGLENGSGGGRRTQVSEDHIRALQKIARKQPPKK